MMVPTESCPKCGSQDKYLTCWPCDEGVNRHEWHNPTWGGNSLQGKEPSDEERARTTEAINAIVNAMDEISLHAVKRARELLGDAARALESCTTDEGPEQHELNAARETLSRIKVELAR